MKTKKHAPHFFIFPARGVLSVFLFIFLIPGFVFAEDPAKETLSPVGSSPVNEITAAPNSDAPLSFSDKRDQEGYLLNIKELIKKSKAKINEVDEKIKEQAIRRRNIQREEQARAYYDQAMKYFQEGNLKQAKIFWQKSVEVMSNPEMRGYISESAQKVKLREKALKTAEQQRLKRLEVERGYTVEEVDDAYDRAVALFKAKKYLEAKEEFGRVDEMFPDHRATRSYLMLVDQEIQKQQQELIDQKIHEEAVANRKAREAWRVDLELQKNQEQNQLSDQAESVYQKALHEYGLRKFNDAKKLFQEVEYILPDYKSTKRYLTKIDLEEQKETAIAKADAVLTGGFEEIGDHAQVIREEVEADQRLRHKETQEKEWLNHIGEEVEFLYSTGLNLYNKQRYAEAKGKFKEVQRLYPDYKLTEKYLGQIEQELEKNYRQSIDADETVFQKKLKEIQLNRQREEDARVKALAKEEQEWIAKLELESRKIYDEAVGFYTQNQLDEAKTKFKEVESLYPNYLGTRKYLERIQEKVSQRDAKLKQEEDRSKDQKRQELQTAKQKKEESRLAELKQIEEVRGRKLKDEAEIIYRVAVEMFNKKFYEHAREKFLAVNNIFPHYSATDNYIAQAEKRIAEDDEQRQSEKQKAEERRRREEALIFQKEALRQQQLAEIEQKETKERQAKETEILYNSAVALYQKGLFAQSKAKFLSVDNLAANYKSTRDYVDRINRDVLGEKSQAWPAVRPAAAAPQSAASKILNPLSARQARQTDDFVPSPGTKEQLLNRADAAYRSAVEAYRQGLYRQAKAKFLQTDQIYPGYSATKRYLQWVEEKLTAEQGKDQPQSLARSSAPQSAAAACPEPLVERRAPPEPIRSEPVESATDATEAKYQRAVKAYQSGQIEKAKIDFIQLEAVTPDYKDTRRFLKDIDTQKITRTAAAKIPVKAKKTTPSHDRNQKAALAQKPAAPRGNNPPRVVVNNGVANLHAQPATVDRMTRDEQHYQDSRQKEIKEETTRALSFEKYQNELRDQDRLRQNLARDFKSKQFKRGQALDALADQERRLRGQLERLQNENMTLAAATEKRVGQWKNKLDELYVADPKSLDPKTAIKKQKIQDAIDRSLAAEENRKTLVSQQIAEYNRILAELGDKKRQIIELAEPSEPKKWT
ncbi:MAG: hypothetical protein HQL23_09525, partial [Candidatus Omnitrophica bacterium]|nr:hypothetical protein [Candidatus Omnitrophota bacterium]